MKIKDKFIASSSDLSTLVVINKLTIGKACLSPNKVVSTYRVQTQRETKEFELIYRYEDDVFDLSDNRHQNIANLLVAQPALNYGLFCKQIEFLGHYDSYDQDFLKEMAKNTAREIYVNKLLKPNPFLVGELFPLAPIKQKTYLQAKLLFQSRSPSKASISKKNDLHSKSKTIAVLSSGGKDSLLSYGLLEELGYEIYPIFINESGRHWFTALNAYRSFSLKDSNTCRVWTNTDRLFTWMLRQIPFIRPNFSEIRADIYPLRLWTVAVFLFGALPIVHKHNIEQIVIGNEYDTTARESLANISHYSGLYDQSRFFDIALSRFYQRKGWRLSQYSILRSLSEIFIEKILFERYPDLQKDQISCHAASIRNERSYPCGHCEKCRRVVAMLMAIGANPEHCGYTQKNINQCLHAFSEKGVHQEKEGMQHTAWLLKEKGLLTSNLIAGHKIVPREEILKIRFDSEHSLFDTIPEHLRAPLFKIFLEHGLGATQKRGRIWHDIDILNTPELKIPYRFNKPFVIDNDIHDNNNGVKGPFLGALSWPEVIKRVKEVDLALLPVGAIEQHGPHLPVDTDSFDAHYLAEQVALRCSSPMPLVLPLVPYGVSYHHEDFPGTISVSNDALARYIYDIGMSSAKSGITKLVIINGHGGNTATLSFAAQMINQDAHIFTCVDTGETSDIDIDAFIETNSDVHAGEIETSTALATRPDLVTLNAAVTCIPKFSNRYLSFSSKRSVEWYTRTAHISKSGVLGDPSKASAEKGRRIWKVMISNLVEFVEQLKKMSLDEIYQRRY